MGLEKQPTGRFNGVCDACDKTIELQAYGPVVAGYKLRQFGWKRAGYLEANRCYLYHCTACAEKELAF